MLESQDVLTDVVEQANNHNAPEVEEQRHNLVAPMKPGPVSEEGKKAERAKRFGFIMTNQPDDCKVSYAKVSTIIIILFFINQ